MLSQKRGDNMKLGFIGAGRAGCSLGKYFSIGRERADIRVVGYSSLLEEEARWAAEFTDSVFYEQQADLIAASDTIVISTPDGAVKDVWESVDKDKIQDKTMRLRQPIDQ